VLDKVLSIVSALMAEAPQARDRASGRASEFRDHASRRAAEMRDQASRRAADIRDDVADRVHRVGRKVSDAVRSSRKEESSAMENAALFVTGIGVGVGLALLLAPSSGSDLRNQIRTRAAEAIDSFRENYRQALGPDDEPYMGV
jgi:gas vesicle protein